MAKKNKLDAIDLRILKILTENAKISNLELSQAVGISPSPCLRRVNILQELGIIKNYHAKLDLEVLGYNLVIFASININVDNDEQKQEFEKSLIALDNILEAYTLNTDRDYLTKIIVRDYAEYKVFINSKLAILPYVKSIRTTRIKSCIKYSNFIGDNS